MLLLLTIFASTTARTTAAAKERHFVSANVRLAGKIPYPASSVDAGFVTLSVNLDETGKLTSVDILRDLPDKKFLESRFTGQSPYRAQYLRLARFFAGGLSAKSEV